MPPAPVFSLERFERLAWRREHESAWRELLLLLGQLDEQGGQPAWALHAPAPDGLQGAALDLHLCTRAAAAVACLLTDAQLQFSPTWVAPVMARHRWLAALFAASAWGSGDALIRAINSAAADDATPGTLAIAPHDIVKFCLLYAADSALPLDLGALWRHDRQLAIGLAIALLSPRLLATPAAHAKRELLLPWLAGHLGDMADVTDVPQDVLHDVYMQCSYAQRADKHDVKRAISALVQRSLQRRGFEPASARPPGVFTRLAPLALPAGGAKPVLLVVVEWFMAGHSIYRTHSRTIEGARACFQVVGMGYGFTVDAAGRQAFDHFIEIPRTGDIFTQLRQVQQEAQDRGAAALYMPSVGMSALTMFLANLRVAGLQVMGLGHPATAHAAAIDAVLVEDDYVGDPACFSETLLRLPPDGMPYRPAHDTRPAAAPAVGAPPSPPSPPVAPAQSARPAPVQIALCATVMKLNPTWLQACADVARRSPVPVHFQVLVGQAQGLLLPQVVAVVRRFLGPCASVHGQQPYAPYMAAIQGCDMFMNPFPFGNTNGIIDCVSAGLVGVCKTGPEVHEHIDHGMFARLGWPGWLTAPTVAAYVDAALRLAASPVERAALRRQHAGPDKVALFYAGRPQIMGELLRQALPG